METWVARRGALDVCFLMFCVRITLRRHLEDSKSTSAQVLTDCLRQRELRLNLIDNDFDGLRHVKSSALGDPESSRSRRLTRPRVGPVSDRILHGGPSVQPTPFFVYRPSTAIIPLSLFTWSPLFSLLCSRESHLHLPQLLPSASPISPLMSANGKSASKPFPTIEKIESFVPSAKGSGGDYVSLHNGKRRGGRHATNKVD